MENAPTGVVINYLLKNDVEDVTIRIYQGSRLIKEIDADTTAGLNTEVWDMSGRVRERTEEEKEQAQSRQRRMQSQFGGGGGFGRQTSGGDSNWIEARVRPGEFRVELIVNGRSQVKKAVIMPDYWSGK